MIQVKRVYETPAPHDGCRVLVDRLWPRGVSKSQAAVDFWSKEVAPSPGLRTWFGHDPQKFTEFSRRYRQELSENLAVADLRTLIEKNENVTLIYAAKSTTVNHAVVLRDFLLGKSG